MYNKFTIKTEYDNGMMSEITTDNLRTSVQWKLKPENTDFMGTIPIEKFEKL